MDGVKKSVISVLLLSLVVITAAIIPVGVSLCIVETALMEQARANGEDATPEEILAAAEEIADALVQIRAGIGNASTPDTMLYDLDHCMWGLNTMLDGIGDTTTDATMLFATARILESFDDINLSFNSSVFPQLAACSVQVSSGGTLYGLVSGAMPEPQRSQALDILDDMALDLGEADATSSAIHDAIGDVLSLDTLSFAVSQIQSALNQMKAGIGSVATPGTLLYTVALLTSGLSQILLGIGSATIPGTMLYGMAYIAQGLSDIISSGIVDTSEVLAMIDAAQQIADALEQIQAGIGDASTPGTMLNGIDGCMGGLNSMLDGIGDTLTDNTMLFATAQLLESFGQMIISFDSDVFPQLAACSAQVTSGGTLHGLISGAMPEPQRSQALDILDDMALYLGEADATSSAIYDAIGDVLSPGTLAYAVSQIQSALNQMKDGIGDVGTTGTMLFILNACASGLNQISYGIGDVGTTGTMLFGMAYIIEGLEGLLPNTPEGFEVIVETEQGIKIIFDEVTAAGDTIAAVQPAPEIPGFSVLDGSCFDISTTATHSGMIEVSLPYDEGSVLVPEQELKILHYEGGAWADVTTQVDTAANLVKGEVSGFSLFAIAWEIKQAVITYTGDGLVTVDQPVSLSATISEEDGSPGDIGLAGQAVFEIIDPHGGLVYSGPADIEMVDGEWEAQVTVGPLAANVYTVVTSLAENDFYMADAVESQLAVYDPEGGFVTGGGLLWDGGLSTFGFCVKPSKCDPRLPRGNLVFVDHSNPWRPLVVKGKGFSWLVIPEDEDVAYVAGTCSVRGEDGYSFLLTVEDLGCWFAGRDTVHLVVEDASSVVYEAQGTVVRGDIEIHRKPARRGPCPHSCALRGLLHGAGKRR